ncbi:XdhC/CoxI family protein [Acetobacterium sp.]|uniref:XdhC family protein n=1 Tax=Acetobacterium sp. TaxID=1872094 RepID=UPI00271D80F8|nr:XdhC/CoxI family protein [Acetobacterium sp.]MDO9493243.1 XdhC family protein [Acetobacterium sp.]
MENQYDKLIEDLKQKNQVVMLTRFKTVNEAGKIVIEKSLISKDELESVDTQLQEAIENILIKGLPELITTANKETVLCEPFYSEGRLIILGGGHIAKPLAKYGADIGFKVTVVDDRPSFANEGRFPEASQVLCESFETCFDRLQVNASDYVVIVTRGHRHDAVCLRQVLESEPEYLGMIGSKRRVKNLMELLVGEGLDEGKLNQVYSPIGLRIGAVTPEEIAISIMAEIISKKRLSQSATEAPKKRQTNQSDFDYEVLENLANDDTEKRAIVTVVSKKGSVPRGPGAKMIIWADGRSRGSIGGGCSEAEVSLVARDLLQTGSGYHTMKVDMTGSVAEDEGMVCGGIMDVLIEVYP